MKVTMRWGDTRMEIKAPHSEHDGILHYLTCNFCGKRCSSGFLPTTNEFGTTLVVRAAIMCPECIEQQAKEP